MISRYIITQITTTDQNDFLIKKMLHEEIFLIFILKESSFELDFLKNQTNHLFFVSHFVSLMLLKIYLMIT